MIFGRKRYSCRHVVPIEQEPRHHLELENEFVRAFAVEIAPHDRTLCHEHEHDYLLYVVGDAEIISAARDEEPKRLSYRDGECDLSTAGMVHIVENLRDTPFRNIVIELLPRVGELFGGTSPVRISNPAESSDVTEPAMAGSSETKWTKIPPHFESEKVSVFRTQTNATYQAATLGPAVVASLEFSSLDWNRSGKDPFMFNDSLMMIHNLKGLAYIPPGVPCFVGGNVAELVVYQLGLGGEEPLGVRTRNDPLKNLRAHADEPE
jgi:hypothetical protein